MKKIYRIIFIIFLLLSVSISSLYLFLFKQFELVFALQDNNTALLNKLVLEDGYNPNSKILGIGVLAFYLSSKKNDVKAQTVETFLKLGANPNLKTWRRLPYLSMAIAGDRPDIVKVLIDCGADVNALDKLGMTSLDEALILKNFEMVNMLLEKNAKLAKHVNNENIYELSVKCVKQRLCNKTLLQEFDKK